MIDSRFISYHKLLPFGEFITLNSYCNDLKISHTLQTHSTIICELSNNDLSQTESDGIISKLSELKKGHFIAIKTADCMPIVILGDNEVIFVHAGWKGLADGILKNPIIKKIRPYYAFIGPSIQKDSFEVSDDFELNFPHNSNFYHKNGKLYFDLQKEAQDQLYALYDGINVESSQEDTMLNKKFHSFRRDKTTLRNWNLFTL